MYITLSISPFWDSVSVTDALYGRPVEADNEFWIHLQVAVPLVIVPFFG